MIGLCREPVPFSAGGFTLVELLMAMAITAMLSVVLGGLVMAVQTGREHSEGFEEATVQARAGLDRIAWMVTHAGVYRAGGGPTTLGLAVVSRETIPPDLPEVLVVWSGGRDGGMADRGIQLRLPRIDELVIYAPAADDPRRLVEFAVPTNPASIDFQSLDFAETVRSLVRSPEARPAMLCDRLRRSRLSAGGFGSQQAAYVRFDLVLTPGDDELATAAPGSADWYALPWTQGIVAGDSGLRQATLRIEMQVSCRPPDSARDDGTLPSHPFFGSASRRYVYQP